MKIEKLIDEIRARPDCEVAPPAGLPTLPNGTLPRDVASFYESCGGVKIGIFEDEIYSWRIVGPDEFIQAPSLVFQGFYDPEIWDDHWAQSLYVFALTQNDQERIILSCGSTAPGIFFDGHVESFACDDMRVVGESLEEVITNLLSASLGMPLRPATPSQQKYLADFQA